MTEQLSDISRAFLNNYFHLMCKEPKQEELQAFYKQESINLISEYTSLQHEQMLTEARLISEQIVVNKQKLKPLFYKKIFVLLIGMLTVVAMFALKFHWATFIALFIAFVYARHVRRSHTLTGYVLLSLEGLAHIFKHKFDIDVDCSQAHN